VNVRVALAMIAVAGLIPAALVFVPGTHGSASAEARAAATVTMFFRSINARHYARTCELMSVRFYRENHVPTKERCVLGLRVGFMWSPSIRFRIIGVLVDGRRAVVTAIANGAPGRIVLVDDHGSFRILSVSGS
jgi:hypothetical protein